MAEEYTPVNIFDKIMELSKFDAEYLLPGHNTEFGNIIQGREKVRENFAFIKKYYYPML